MDAKLNEKLVQNVELETKVKMQGEQLNQVMTV